MNSKVTVLGGTAAAGTAVTVAGIEGWAIPTGLAEAGGWSLFLGLVVFNLYGIFKGWVVPKPYYDAEKARAEAAEAANERLSERAAKLTDTNAVQARALEKNAAAADTTIKVMGAVQEARLAAAGGSE